MTESQNERTKMKNMSHVIKDINSALSFLKNGTVIKNVLLKSTKISFYGKRIKLSNSALNANFGLKRTVAAIT